MLWILIIPVIGLVVLCFMRWKFVDPILEIIESCGRMNVHILMRSWESAYPEWKKLYIRARSEFMLRQAAVSRIQEIEYPRIRQMLMFPRENRVYNAFIDELECCKSKLAEAECEFKMHETIANESGKQ